MKDFQKIYTIVLFILGYITNVIAQQNMNTEQYIKMYKDIAVREMQKTGIPASITLAQGLLESGVGNSSLAKEGNNHFGIKCHQDWTGRTMLLDDDAPDECFRVYPTAEASFIDHSMFLTTKQRYASLFQLPRYDYQSWAKGLKQAGYATNPQYAEILISLIEKNKLYEYDIQEVPSNLTEKNIAENKKWDKQHENANTISSTSPILVNNSILTNGKPEYNKKGTHPDKGIVYYNNKIKAVKAKAGETPVLVAQKYDLSVDEICNYNDMSPMAYFDEGCNIYLQPKRKKCNEKTHLVAKNQNMWDISQQYGVKLSELYIRNKMNIGEEPLEKELVYLSSDAPNKPAIRSITPKTEEPKIIPQITKTISEKSNQQLLEPVEIKSTKTLADVIEENDSKNMGSTTTIATTTPTIQQVIEEKSINIAPEIVVATEKLDNALNKLEELEKEIAEPTAIERKPHADTTLYPFDATPFNFSQEQIIDTEEKTQNYTPIVTSTATENPTNVVHKVEKGDTLYNLSKRYNVPVNQIVSTNNIQNMSIKLGQDLIIK